MLIGRQTTLIHRVKGDQLDLGMTHGFSLDGKVMQVRPLTVTSHQLQLYSGNPDNCQTSVHSHLFDT